MSASRKEYNATWSKNNLEKRRETNKKWRDENKGVILQLNSSRIKKFTEEFKSGSRARAETKKCSICKITKKANEFYLSNTNSDGLHGWCKVCSDIRTTENSRKRLHGLTPEDIKEMYVAQENKCAICRIDESLEKRKFSLDHCHITGNVRALLCTNCNALLGHAKDNIDTLKNSIKYLEKNNAN